VQPPSALGVRLTRRGHEPRAGVEHFDAQYAFLQGDAHLHITVLAHVLDRVGDELGHQQPGVLERLGVEFVAHSVEKQARLRR
jgi:hypothetical protein